jgi:Kef-type K+ transport system membrane component KefB
MDAAHRTARRDRSIAGWDLLGPSVFGTIWPAGQQAIFPPSASDRQMLNAVSELGVLLLLLLTGMETDLALVKRVRRTAVITSAAGIVIPFACGYVLGEMLPDSGSARSESTLAYLALLATALSISSVKRASASFQPLSTRTSRHDTDGRAWSVPPRWLPRRTYRCTPVLSR